MLSSSSSSNLEILLPPFPYSNRLRLNCECELLPEFERLPIPLYISGVMVRLCDGGGERGSSGIEIDDEGIERRGMRESSERRLEFDLALVVERVRACRPVAPAPK